MTKSLIKEFLAYIDTSIAIKPPGKRHEKLYAILEKLQLAHGQAGI